MLEWLFGQTSTRSITPGEVRERQASGEKVILLDVRTPEEYAEIHIPHSISLPLDQVRSRIAKVAGDKSAEIIVYCLSGARAATACRELSAMGYTNVRSLGGIRSWPYETVRGRA